MWIQAEIDGKTLVSCGGRAGQGLHIPQQNKCLTMATPVWRIPPILMPNLWCKDSDGLFWVLKLSRIGEIGAPLCSPIVQPDVFAWGDVKHVFNIPKLWPVLALPSSTLTSWICSMPSFPYYLGTSLLHPSTNWVWIPVWQCYHKHMNIWHYAHSNKQSYLGLFYIFCYESILVSFCLTWNAWVC
jgi:hypothetical protein